MRNPYPNFVWFFGVAEETSGDPLKLGRVRVRAVGFHPKNGLSTEQLPWAPVLNGGAAKINNGQMILGFFMDGEEAQQPVVLGVLGGGTSSADTPFSSSPTTGGLAAIVGAAAAGLITPETTRPVDGSCPKITTGVLESARAWIGYHEIEDKKCLTELFNSQLNVTVDPQYTAWCGYFVASILASQGISYPKAYWASWAWASSKYNTQDKNGYGTVIWEKGTKESKLDAANIQPKDIAFFNFGSQGHVAIVTESGLPGNKIKVIGGNQSAKVSEKTYNVSDLRSVVRPPSKQ